MGLHGFIWVEMGFYGFYGFIWVCMGLSGFIWACMVSDIQSCMLQARASTVAHTNKSEELYEIMV
jgi:hypothetical protein